ncbi:hypothetical protein [Methanocaldococcus sp.]|uniref:hypothetical protein n=1 Tax=Methanocaldococcus sp. TaxID=2152917 RepID=UPI002615DD71|nr:hypothetical protein [Methanocaldococcus sp.]MCQ6254817.1 hypothetical protein [Methanocaldococcus sp.]
MKTLNIFINTLLIFFILSLTYSLPTEPLIFVNKSTVDYQNAKILLDNFYSSRTINVSGNNITLKIKDIEYIPAKNTLIIKENDRELIIKFTKNNKEIKYNDITYKYYNNFEKGKEINFFNKNYIVENVSPKYITLKEKNSEKEIITNGSFEYNGYKIILKMVSLNYNTLYINIYKNGTLLESPKLVKGVWYYLKNENLGILYKNYSNKKYVFDIVNIIKIEKDKDFPLNNSFVVEDIDSNKLVLKYKYPNNLSKNICIFNYKIIPEMIYKNYVLFKVIKRYCKTLNIKDKDIVYIGEGFYTIKVNGSTQLYYKGHKIKNNEKVYINTLSMLDTNNILNINKDIILVGGPKVNKFVKYLESKSLLLVNITNNYPGNNIGIIQKIKNPYNKNYNIYILAGSNRYGTKAAILAFLTKYNDESIMKVKWNNGHIEVIR